MNTRLAAIAIAALSLGIAAAPAAAASDHVVQGTFPIDDQFVLDYESGVCGFPITLTVSGQGRYTALLDDQGLNQVVHVHERTVGTLSANGIELRDFVSMNSTYDFPTLTKTETGIVRDKFLHGGIVLMDRGRLVWNFVPSEGGDTVGDPIFEAGQHPGLHGDLAALCEALTP